MTTTQEYGLETIKERLRRIIITYNLCLGTKLSMTTERIISQMSDDMIIRMFNDNIDAQYILLDSQGY